MRAIGHLLAHFDAHLGDEACVRRLDDVFHFHRLEHDQRLVLADMLACVHRDFDHPSWHRRRKPPETAAGVAITRGLVRAQLTGSLKTKAVVVPLDHALVVVVPDGDRVAVYAETLAQPSRAKRPHVELVHARVDHNTVAAEVG